MPSVLSKPADLPEFNAATLSRRVNGCFAPCPLLWIVARANDNATSLSSSRCSLLVSLFRRCCPIAAFRRLLLAGSALILCSGCNLLTPTLLGVAVDAAASTNKAAANAATSISSLTASGGTRKAAAATAVAARTIFRGVFKALQELLSGGGRAALQQQPPKVLFTLVCGVVILGAIMSFLRTSQLETAEQEMRAEVRRQLFDSLLQTPPSFFSCRNAGLLLPLFQEDTNTLVSAFSHVQAQMLRYCSSAFGGSAVLLMLSPRLTAFALIVLPLAGFSAMLLARRMRALQRVREDIWQQCSGYLSDRITHMNTIYLHQQQQQEACRFARQQQQLLDAARETAWANGLFYGGLSFSINSTVLALLVLGTALVKQKIMTYGSLTSFAVYSSMVGVGFSGLSSLSNDFSRAAAAAARIQAVFTAAAAATIKAPIETEKTTTTPYSAGSNETSSKTALLLAEAPRLTANAEKWPTDKTAAVAAATAAAEGVLATHSSDNDQWAEDVTTAQGNAKKEKTKQLKQPQQQQWDEGKVAEQQQGPEALRLQLQAVENGKMSPQELSRKIRGQIEFCNVTFSYQAAALETAAALAGSVGQLADHSSPSQQQSQHFFTTKSSCQTTSQIQLHPPPCEGTGLHAPTRRPATTGRNAPSSPAAGPGSSPATAAAGLSPRPDSEQTTTCIDSPTALAGESPSSQPQQQRQENMKKPQQQQQQNVAGGVEGINLCIKPGSITAITGASGSGKSTLFKLMTKQLQPQQGRITLDGLDIQVIPTHLLLQSVLGVVNADSSALMSGLSIRENLLYGVWLQQQQRAAAPPPVSGSAAVAAALHTETMIHSVASSKVVAIAKENGVTERCNIAAAATVSKRISNEAPQGGVCNGVDAVFFEKKRTAASYAEEAMLKEACRLCAVDSFLPDSLDSTAPAAENANKSKSFCSMTATAAATGATAAAAEFSAGEVQRLGLARTLVKQPAVLLLDEATAHLDACNERMLLETLSKLVKRKEIKNQQHQNSCWSCSGGFTKKNDVEHSSSAVAQPAAAKALSAGGLTAATGPASAATVTSIEEDNSLEVDFTTTTAGAQANSTLLENGVQTIILIAHSKAALQLADTVVVLRNGCLVEEGSFESLLQRPDGELTHLLQQQQQRTENGINLVSD